MSTLTKESLAERVAAHLRRQILLRELPELHHLNEARLAEQLGVSRGSVRGGLQLLEREGLIQTPSNGRSITTGLSSKDLHDLFIVRKLLEGEAIQTILDQGMQNRLAPLENVVTHMRSERQHKVRIELDVDFHFQLVVLSNNRSLLMSWSVMRNIIAALIGITSDIIIGQRLDQVIDDHAGLVNLLKQKQGKLAVALLHRHLDAGEAIMQKHLLMTLSSESDRADGANG